LKNFENNPKSICFVEKTLFGSFKNENGYDMLQRKINIL
jgi:hypothetical protein